jgi:hypothetical protein
MKRITAIELAILVIAGLVPLLWFHPGYIIANGDNFPIFLNAQKTFSSATNMWSPDYLGYASPVPSYLIYQDFGAFLSYLGLSTGFIQVLLQVLLDIGAGLSMYYFARVIYPDHKNAPFFAAFFYMFNFFIMNFWFNLGFAWLYAFLPLLLALFVSSVNAAYSQDKKASNMRIICLTLVSVVALSVASINPANIVLFILAFAVMGVYLIVKHIKNLKPLLFSLGRIIPIAFLVNLWWIFPMLMAFIFSPQGLNSQVNIAAWSWTHIRASFLNLFWLNGTWGWLPQYVPFYDFYSNPVVLALMFVPFIVAGVALLLKDNKSRFNAYIMFSILIFLFLAKGIHDLQSDPLAQVNLFLYNNISLMSMFREPASKFTFLIMPFLALLIGYSCDRIATVKLNIKPAKLKLARIFVLLFIVGSFVVSSAPIFNLGLTYEPSSSYVQIPQYWFDASNWINNQPGNGRILLSPLDDFYQIPYTWNYSGSDQLLERFFNKPIVSTAAIGGYVTNPNTTADLRQIREAVKFNQKDEFKALLDLLSIKYIIQRNDVVTNITGTSIVSSDDMRSFFHNQPYLKLVKTFGEIEIYEYSEAKSSLFALLPSSLQQTDIHIDTTTILNQEWAFSQQTIPEDWSNGTTNGWITFNSTNLPAPIESIYTIRANFNTTNFSGISDSFNSTNVYIRIAEFDTNSNFISITNGTNSIIGDSNYTFYNMVYEFEPKNDFTHSIQIQFWDNAISSSNCFVQLNSINVTGTVSTSHLKGIENLFGNQAAPVINIKSESPTETVVAVNSTQPFVLATTQILDGFWVANVNGQQIQPMSTYLGLKGFLINQTGQFDVTLVYKPQQWFSYSLIVSGVTVLFLCIAILYLQRTQLKGAYQKIRKPKS